MPFNDALATLLPSLRDLRAWLKSGGVPHVVVGGVARAFLSKPRLTEDIDAVALAPEESWEALLRDGAQYGFRPRIPDALAFARHHRMLLLEHVPSSITVDISMGALPFEEEMIARAVCADVEGVEIPLPTPEDLIIMKAVAMRDKDVDDIRSVLEANPAIDTGRVRRWTRDFAEALEMPEIARRLEDLLESRHVAQPRPKRPRKRR